MTISHETFRATVSPEVRQRVLRVAHRIHAELRALLDQLPPEARSQSGLSQAIGVERTSCHRVIAAIRPPQPSPPMLLRLPGVQGLHMVIDAIEQTYPELDVEGARAAVKSLAELLTSLGGGRRHLEALLRTPSKEAEASQLGARMRLFEAASEVTGKHADVLNSIRLYAPLPEDARRFVRVSLAGWAGLVSHPNAMPTSWVSGSALSAEQRKTSKLHGNVLIPEFSSDPLPRLVAKEIRDGQVAQVVDFEGNYGQPFDLFLANQATDPELEPDQPANRLERFWSMVDLPTKAVVTDFYLHRSVAPDYRVWVDSHLWGPLPTPPTDPSAWLKRLPDVPQVESLGEGIDGADDAPYDQQRALTQHLFELVGWDPNEFVGFRVEQNYPVWRSGLCLVFDTPTP